MRLRRRADLETIENPAASSCESAGPRREGAPAPDIRANHSNPTALGLQHEPNAPIWTSRPEAPATTRGGHGFSSAGAGDLLQRRSHGSDLASASVAAGPAAASGFRISWCQRLAGQRGTRTSGTAYERTRGGRRSPPAAAARASLLRARQDAAPALRSVALGTSARSLLTLDHGLGL